MNLKNRNLSTLFIAVLGATKLILQAFGIDVITNQQIDTISNGLAALITVIGVIMTHLKDSPSNNGGNPPQPWTSPGGPGQVSSQPVQDLLQYSPSQNSDTSQLTTEPDTKTSGSA